MKNFVNFVRVVLNRYYSCINMCSGHEIIYKVLLKILDRPNTHTYIYIFECSFWYSQLIWLHILFFKYCRYYYRVGGGSHDCIKITINSYFSIIWICCWRLPLQIWFFTFCWSRVYRRRHKMKYLIWMD